jgi:hypothetical protein
MFISIADNLGLDPEIIIDTGIGIEITEETETEEVVQETGEIEEDRDRRGVLEVIRGDIIKKDERQLYLIILHIDI